MLSAISQSEKENATDLPEVSKLLVSRSSWDILIFMSHFKNGNLKYI